jgi:hypothetical protein
VIGDWAITSFTEIATSPIYRAKGTEMFSGCLDVKRDGTCKGDPSGTLSFRFSYWALLDEGGGLVWGTCTHPVSGGTGAFAGARGVIAMVDTPTARGVSCLTSGTCRSAERRSRGRTRAWADTSRRGCA